MNEPAFIAMRLRDDVALLAGLKREWIWCLMASLVAQDNANRYYYGRLANTADELIVQLEAKLVRRYL